MIQATGGVSTQTPMTRAEYIVRLEALRERRDEIESQLQSTTTQRGRLGQERMNAQARGDAAMVREYEGTVAALGGRMTELQRTKLAVEREIDGMLQAAATGGVQDAPGIPELPPPPPMAAIEGVPSDIVAGLRANYEREMFVGGTVLLLLAVVLYRVGFWRGSKRVTKAVGGIDTASLQMSVDAIAVEVERISENQRFLSRLMAGKDEEHAAMNAPGRDT